MAELFERLNLTMLRPWGLSMAGPGLGRLRSAAEGSALLPSLNMDPYSLAAVTSAAVAAGSRNDSRVSLRAAGIEAYGGEVTVLELPEPPPLEAGQMLIEVRAARVGNWDEIVRTGGWDVGRVPPLALGVEAAGEVIAVGPGVEWPAIGAGVMTHPLPLPYQGCWAERLVAPAHLEAEKPENASWRELEGCSPGLSVDFPRGPGDDGRVQRLSD